MNLRIEPAAATGGRLNTEQYRRRQRAPFGSRVPEFSVARKRIAAGSANAAHDRAGITIHIDTSRGTVCWRRQIPSVAA